MSAYKYIVYAKYLISMNFQGILTALSASFAKLSYNVGVNHVLAVILRYVLAVFIIINLYETIDL